MKDSDSFLEVSSSIDIVKIIEVGLALDWVIVVNIKWWRLFFCFLCCRIVAICCLLVYVRLFLCRYRNDCEYGKNG